MPSDAVLRQQLLALLRGGQAYTPFPQVVADFPPEHMNSYPPQVPYTPWHILEHLRITQWDILEFIRNPAHVSPPWPDGYWPARDALADADTWAATLASFQSDLDTLQALVADETVDLTAPLPHAPGYTILREILVVADHNAYHIGEFSILRQVMQTWA
jgi:hypothetical protein